MKEFKMSQQAVLQFVQRINKDQVFASKVNMMPVNDIGDVVKFAKDNGFDFTADEFENTFVKPFKESRGGSGELKDEDLEQIAGGASDIFTPTQNLLNFADVLKIHDPGPSQLKP